MSSLLRVKSRWSGFNGAPGYTVMHFRDFGTGEGPGTDPDAAAALSAVTKTRTFFAAVASLLPSAVRIQVEPEVEVIESTTGQLQDIYSVTAPGVVSGTQSFGYSASSGAVINWRTSGIRNGRRIRGRSFLVPLSSSSYDTAGQLIAASRTTITNAAAALGTPGDGPDLGVYARPTGPGAADGVWFVSTSSTVPALLAVLRSRRD